MRRSLNAISRILHDQAQKRPDSLAIRTKSGTFTYAQLNDRVRRCAALLAQKGIQNHEICGVSVNSPVLLVIVRLALADLNRCSVLMPWSLTRLQVDDMLASAGATIVVTNHDVPVSPDRACHVTSADVARFDMASSVPNGGKAAGWDSITIGSGTTGAPKLIALSADQVAQMVQRVADSFRYRDTDIVLATTRLLYGMTIRRMLAVFLTGGTYYLETQNDEDLIAAIQEHKITCLTTTVFHAELLLRKAQDKIDPSLPSLRIFEVGSSFVSESLIRRIKDTFSNNVLVQYGANECPNVCDRDTTRGPQHRNSIGHVLPTASLEIVDDAGAQVPAGEAGQIRMRAPGMAQGYPNNADLTDRLFKDGWFYPGDLGRFAEDGQVIYLGRTDDMMIFNGNNIYPAEIERVVADHPAVADVVVMPLEHDVHMHVPLCAVSLRPGHTADEQGLKAFATERLGQAKIASIFIVDEVPRNELGKVVRSEMAEIFLQRLQDNKSSGQSAAMT